jgi:DNA-binding MarR family transcriptional regulator
MQRSSTAPIWSTMADIPTPNPIPPRDLEGAALDDALVAAVDAVLPRYGRVLRRALTDAEGDDRLTVPQLRCLQAMAINDGPSHSTRLARALLVSPPTMTRTIDALVERELVARQPDLANRRQICLVLTPSGRELLARYERLIADRLRALLAPLDDPAKRRLLAAVGDLGTVLEGDEPMSGPGR